MSGLQLLAITLENVIILQFNTITILITSTLIPKNLLEISSESDIVQHIEYRVNYSVDLHEAYSRRLKQQRDSTNTG